MFGNRITAGAVQAHRTRCSRLPAAFENLETRPYDDHRHRAARRRLPPRLLPGGNGFIDTMAQYGSYGWWGSDASAPRGMGHLTNEYAAMPSLHVGWSLWCGIMLFRFGRHWTVRALGVLYPVVTALVVMGTANHYLLDAAAGVLVMGIGFALTYVIKRAVRQLSGDIEPAGTTAPATASPGRPGRYLRDRRQRPGEGGGTTASEGRQREAPVTG